MDFYEQKHQQIPHMRSGLTRFRSAPSSYFDSILNTNTAADGGNGGGFGSGDFSKLFNPRASSPETQQIFARFMNSTVSIQENRSQMNPPRKKPSVADKPPRSDHSSQRMYQSHTSPSESSYNRLSGSIKIEVGDGGGSSGGNYSLVRHSSSPAGLFDSINMDTSGVVGQANNTDNIPEFPMSPWDDSTILSDDFIKGLIDDDGNSTIVKPSASDDQKNEVGNRPPIPLSRHLSLPEFALEKLVHDSVPCKLRARRGCATHPRSIAERVRRNKISEGTRKLQELVPNMDKQTNTASMLDLAVDYIKDLQNQVKMLSENRDKCICLAKIRP